MVNMRMLPISTRVHHAKVQSQADSPLLPNLTHSNLFVFKRDEFKASRTCTSIIFYTMIDIRWSFYGFVLGTATSPGQFFRGDSMAPPSPRFLDVPCFACDDEAAYAKYFRGGTETLPALE